MRADRRLGLALGVVAGVLVARAAAGAARRPLQRLEVAGGAPLPTGGGAPGLLTAAGRRPSARPGAAAVPPPAWEPPLLTALAGWVPPPPRTPLGRAAAYLWAAPTTLAGMVAGAASLTVPRRRDGVLLFAPAGGLAGLFLRVRGFSAMAIGHVVVSRHEPSGALMAHELTHVRQAERLGPLMAPVYIGLTAVYGYARHPLERAARVAQRRAMTS